MSHEPSQTGRRGAVRAAVTRHRRRIGAAAAVVAVFGGGIGVGTVTAGRQGVVAISTIQADTVSCTTDANGYCTVGLNLLYAPAAVVVTPSIPLISAVDTITATSFRARFLTQSGAPAATQKVTFGYVATGGNSGGSTPTPAPSASGAPVLSTTIEDTQIGTSTNTVTYAPAANWTQCTPATPCAAASQTANSSYRYAYRTGDSYTVNWSGVQMKIYSVKEPYGGISTITTDGASNGTVDTYNATQQDMPLWTSPILASGNHTTVVTITGQKNQAATATTETFDRADVYSAGSGSPSPSPSTSSSSTTGPLSGLPWLSGVSWDPCNAASCVQAFGTWRGRAADVATVYTDRSSWDGLEHSAWMFNAFAGWPGRLIISQPTFPENAGASYAACATGAYDSYWQEFGRTLVSQGRANSIVRLAWEFNGDYFQWGANHTDTATFKTCFQREATAVRATDPQVLIDWTINAHATPGDNCGGLASNCYPGDGYVDVIGIDNYDHYPPSANTSQWNAMCNGGDGPCTLANMARTHGKWFGMGEWGVVNGQGSNGGGDNPFYIDQTWSLFQSYIGTLLYESYFDDCTAGNVMSDLNRGCGGNPNAAARYLSHYHP